jgi:hypothetical protein
MLVDWLHCFQQRNHMLIEFTISCNFSQLCSLSLSTLKSSKVGHFLHYMYHIIRWKTRVHTSEVKKIDNVWILLIALLHERIHLKFLGHTHPVPFLNI